MLLKRLISCFVVASSAGSSMCALTNQRTGYSGGGALKYTAAKTERFRQPEEFRAPALSRMRELMSLFEN